MKLINYTINSLGEKHFFKYDWTPSIYTQFLEDNNIKPNLSLDKWSEENKLKWSKIYMKHYNKHWKIAKKTQKKETQ